MVLGVVGAIVSLCTAVVDGLFLYSTVDEIGLTLVEGIGVLGHPVRQKVLSLLADEPERTRRDLAAALAADETVDADDVDHLEVQLHHNHLPRLDDELYVQYDQRNGDVVLWKRPADVEAMLDVE